MRHALGVSLLLVALSWAPAGAQDTSDLAKATQNPVADLISVPLQSNFNFTAGPGDDLQYVLNIQPVVPFRLTENWNLITRTIIPLISQPVLDRTPDGVFGDVFGIGDIQLSLFLSPAKPGALIWGVGPVIQLPTASDVSLGADKWAMGPTAVALSVQGSWVFGALANHLWSLESDSRPDVTTSSRCSPASSARRFQPDRPIDGVDQSAFFTGKQPRSNRESLIAFIGESVAAVRWRQFRIYPKQFVPSPGNPAMYGLAGIRLEGNGFPAVFNIEADPREEVNVLGTNAWVIGPYLKVIGEYRKTLEKHPNPRAVDMTDFGRP